MKKVLLFAVAIMVSMAVSSQVIYSENFDNYTPGSYVASSATGWTTWSNMPGSAEDGKITNLHASSGSNSAMISKDNDLVWMLGDSTSGKYEVSLKIYVPADTVAYFNLLHKFAGGSSEWSNEVVITSQDFTIHLYVGGNDTAQATFTFDTWHTISYVVDLDYDFVRMTFDGNEMFSWPFSLDGDGNTGLTQLGAMDFYGYDINNDGTTKLYIDDVKLEKIVNISMVDLEAYNQVSVFPNPVNDFINLASDRNIKSVKILDLTGSVVGEYNVDGLSTMISVADLSSGLYYAQINMGSSIAIRKFVKQ